MTVSVIVPTLNEAAIIEVMLRGLPRHGFHEVIVVDGGSSDSTAQRARLMGTAVTCSKPGRGTQMNAGASASSGDVLLFLHADTVLPPGARQQIEEALADPCVLGGAFHLRFDVNGPLMRLQSLASNVRSYYAVPFGDQAIFARRAFFKETGGFREWPLMEDVDFAYRIKRQGRLKMIRSAVTTSSRGFRKRGFWQTVLKNQLLLAGYHAGVRPDSLAAFY